MASRKFHTTHHCEAFKGQFGNTMEALHDYVAKWLSAERFSGPFSF
ncbi:hypothetical protein [Flintibacter muris]|nr:hypothetical protein [Flintibacter muris]